ncbi:MAG: carbamoyl phosphate synthase small subunit [Clostridiales bacterium]|nr:carbamoyl phosphate synthase small subunit [Clostridiales bacterium]
MESQACLILENGRVFEGKSFGAAGEVTGEVVFTTAMTGYLETLTDPSYYGQIVVQTFPLIGNYGVIPADFESRAPHMRAYIVRDWCQEPSNFRCEGDLDAFLKSRGIPGLYGIDTRALTRVVREHGVMNGRIACRPDVTRDTLEEIRRYRVTGAVAAVSAGQDSNACWGDGDGPHVVLWDFGAKGNIGRELVRRGCRVTAVPYRTTAEEIEALKPDGLMLSNGPGDPAENPGIIAELKKLGERRLPTFGICLGHQLLALSQGARTIKMKYGNRGANQPAREIKTGRVYITSQNHGYAVDADTLPDTARESWVNANDGTCEGVVYLDRPAFSVQFHPEAAAGPQDTAFLFDRFVEYMNRNRNGGNIHAAE